MKHPRIFLVIFILALVGVLSIAQTPKKQVRKPVQVNWVKIVDDELSTIYYDSNIKTDSRGRHIVWVKTIFHTLDWQQYMTQQIGSRTLVYSTKTKAMYDDLYNYAMVRQVIAYSKAGKKLIDTGDHMSGSWEPVNASDPVGLVGEHLSNLNIGY